MKHTRIDYTGFVLRLKKKRADDYGMTQRDVVITGVKPREGYKVPFWQSGTAYFRPSDFEQIVCRVSALPKMPDTDLTPCFFEA